MLPWNIYAQVAFTELELSCSIKTDWTLFILTGQYSACSNVHRRALRHKKNPKSLNCGSPSCPVRQINSYLSNIWTKGIHLPTENEQFDPYYTHPDKDGHKKQNYISHLSDLIPRFARGQCGEWLGDMFPTTSHRRKEGGSRCWRITSGIWKENFKLVSARIWQMGGKAMLK